MRTDFTEARSVLSLVSVQCVCFVHVLTKQSFKKAPGPGLVCTDYSGLFATCYSVNIRLLEDVCHKKDKSVQCRIKSGCSDAENKAIMLLWKL